MKRSRCKNKYDQCRRRSAVSEIKLKGTDTTLDLSQQATVALLAKLKLNLGVGWEDVQRADFSCSSARSEIFVEDRKGASASVY